MIIRMHKGGVRQQDRVASDCTKIAHEGCEISLLLCKPSIQTTHHCCLNNLAYSNHTPQINQYLWPFPCAENQLAKGEFQRLHNVRVEPRRVNRDGHHMDFVGLHTLCYVTLRYAKLCYVMLCCVIAHLMTVKEHRNDPPPSSHTSQSTGPELQWQG
jgi:hypothetical protein